VSAQIARIGNTIAVAIPEDLLRKANLAVGDEVEWALTPSGSLALRSPHGIEESAASAGYEEWKLAEIREGLAEAEAGETVPHEKVVDWLRSWGTENGQPPARSG